MLGGTAPKRTLLRLKGLQSTHFLQLLNSNPPGDVILACPGLPKQAITLPEPLIALYTGI